jgi:NAD(P)-dependent dehydrogenase (short-subunit alcohol dehydrogenase family)
VSTSGIGQGGNAGEAARALAGAIDIHVHNLPDDRPRSIDAIDVAKLARTRGMRAIVLKNHYESTAGIAYLVRTVVPDIEVFGGIDLNLTVGGINPSAVEHMTRVTGGWGRIVWMPTFDAENQVRYSKEARPFVRVSRDGELLPEVKEVIALIARHGLVLATGHSSPAEVMMLVREGQRQGVRRMVVTHAMLAPVLMDVPRMQEVAKLGAFIEFVGGSLATTDGPARLDRIADAIRRVGPQFCILSSDLGQTGNPLPPDGFGAFLVALMAKQNPAQLLGLR